MAYAQVDTHMWYPAVMQNQLGSAPAFNSLLLIDAAGEQASMNGRVWTPGRVSKNIHKIGFRFGAVTKSGGSGLTVSLQDVSLTNGPPMQADGTQDQTVAIANADGGFVSNVWYQTGALSADRTVNPGDLISVVWEYDGGGWHTPDSVIISAISSVSNNTRNNNASCTLNAGGFSAQASVPNVLFEFSDGTFGGLDTCFACSALSTLTFNSGTVSGSGGDERGAIFQVPFNCKIDGFTMFYPATGVGLSDFDIVIYDSDGTTVLKTVSVDTDAVLVGGAANATLTVNFTEVTLLANTNYRVAVKPSSTNNVTYFSHDFANAGYRIVGPYDTTWAHTFRTDAGSWTETTTSVPWFGIRISSVEIGSTVAQPLQSNQFVVGGMLPY